MQQIDDPMTTKEAGLRPRPYVPSRFFMSHVVNPITLWLGGPTLTVRGRRSGRPIRTPIPTLEFEDARYLVSGGGETHWVRNLRAAGQGELRRGQLAARSWLVPSLPADTATTIASAFWIVSLTGFVIAAMSFWGVVVPGSVGRPLAVAVALVSIAGIVLFFGTWPMFNTLAALGVNVAVLVALLWLHWPPQATFGR